MNARRTAENPYWSLAEIQRRYFAAGSAPTKRQLRDWIERGQNGVYLAAVELDGRLFVRASDFERFLAESAAPRRDQRRGRDLREARSSYETAVAKLALVYGDKIFR